MVNVILHPLGQDNNGEGTLHHVLDSPTHSESSTGSFSPLRELFAIIGGGVAPTKSDLKHQHDDEALQR